MPEVRAEQLVDLRLRHLEAHALRQPILPVFQGRCAFGSEIECSRAARASGGAAGERSLSTASRVWPAASTGEFELDARMVVIGDFFPRLHGKTIARFDDQPDATALAVGHTPVAVELFQFEMPLLRFAREPEAERDRPRRAGDHRLRVADHRLLAAREHSATFARRRELLEFEALARAV